MKRTAKAENDAGRKIRPGNHEKFPHRIDPENNGVAWSFALEAAGRFADSGALCPP